MHRPKKITKSQIVGQRGVNLVEQIVLKIGCAWNSTQMDAGIDGYIELRDPATDAALNQVLAVQVKATEGRFLAETAESLEFQIEERDLRYWLSGNTPILLLVTRPKDNEAYWVSIQDHFSDPRRRRTGRAVFNKARDSFHDVSVDILLRLSQPRDSGLYTAPPPREEELVSNLLEVRHYAELIYLAQTDLPSRKVGWGRVADRRVTNEWFVKEGMIFSFNDLSQTAWDSLRDRGTVEPIETTHWAESEDPDLQRDFVQLLNLSLTEKLKRMRVRWNAGEYLYYFLPDRKKHPDRRIKYHSADGRKVRGRP